MKFRIIKDSEGLSVPQYRRWWSPIWRNFIGKDYCGGRITLKYDAEETAVRFIKEQIIKCNPFMVYGPKGTGYVVRDFL